MKQYPKYKDSGVSWIGEIPEHWKIKRIKVLFFENKEKNEDYEFKHALKFNYGRLVSKEEKGDVVELKDTYVAYTKIKENDIAINCLNLNYDFVSQRVAICPQNGILTSAYLTMTPREGVNSHYYNFLFKAMDSKKLFHGMGTGIRLTLSYSELKKQYVVVPPKNEQAAIVSFLDAKTAQIDRIIAEAEIEIEKLNELKQAQIAHLVTHGLNPDAPMKDSGIAWIGQIPEHWKKARYKDVLSIQEEKVGKRKDLTLLSLTKQGVIIRDLTEMKGKFPKDFESYKVVHPDNIILCLFDVDETPRTVGLSHNEGMITGAYDVFSIKNIDKEYFLYHYLSLDDRKAMKPLYKGLRKTIPLPRLMGEHIFIPPKDEQTSIVSAINSMSSKIDTLTTKLNAQIGYLKELKQRIISDAVTGKIDVREVNN